MSGVAELRARIRNLTSRCTTKEAKLRTIRDYCRQHIPNSWHYPDDREPCPCCPTTDRGKQHPKLLELGIRGYLGTGPFAIVSDKPSGDFHFQSRQAGLYYSKLKRYGLEFAFQTDVLNTSEMSCDRDLQKALFLAQVEVVQPKAMLVMDKSSRPRKRGNGWYKRRNDGPLQVMQRHFDADGFSFEIDPDFDMRAAIVRCELPGGPAFSFEVYRIFHYVKLTDHRRESAPEAKWEEWFARVTAVARLTLEVAEAKAHLEK